MANFYERELKNRLSQRSQSRRSTLDRLRAAEAARVPTHTFKAALDGSCIYDGLPELAPVHERATTDTTDTNGEVHYGVMIALFPPAHVAHQLAVEGGESPEELHVTLAFLGKKADLGDRYGELQKVVADFAKEHGPLSGEVSGLGLFTAGPKPVTYASVDVPGLPHFRQELVKTLEAAGFTVSKDHGYTPHMTLAYDDRRHVNPANLDLTFGQVTLAVGGDRTSYELTGVESARAKTKGEKQHKYKHPVGNDANTVDDSKFMPPCADCNLPSDDLIHMALGDPESNGTPIDMNDDGVPDNYKTGVAARPFPKGGPKQAPTPAPIGAGLDTEFDAAKCMQGIDATVDQATVLLRSCNADELPEYALQARDLLQALDEACDSMLAYFGVSDADDASEPTVRAQVTEPGPVAPDAAPDAPLQRAFISEINGHTYITGPADLNLDGWEKAASQNEHMMWIQGRFVGGEEANRNGAFWSTQDLEFGKPTVAHGPLNWLHESRHIIGTIADAKLVQPGEQAADGGVAIPHINALSNVWRWIYPDEADVIEMASDAGKLWYSMECISKNVECVGEGGCGQVASYMDYLKNANVCDHMRERSSTRRFAEPTFLGGAVIVPPVRPGWAAADARVMREAASLAELSYETARPSMPASEWELLMAQLVRFAG